MSKGARSVFVFGLYLFLLGGILIIAPNILLQLFSVPPTTEVWIRVAGMLIIFLGFYYVQTARNEIIQFFRWSVYVRASVIVFFVMFVVLGLAPSQLIIFGAIDLLAAVWTALELRSAKSLPKIA
jgi:hypothetical protein